CARWNHGNFDIW
nr:immunoglobulin heavy chain junction region [Macaca mulatta]MOW23351.1 immunoglobulin heavy chain junction region [Macaca mulatta]MOW23392.1 immunoglobulin heavy chain junction region [Macaca mulatta]MOW23419.1 immunoglobulin heavy chain junction region [Macaca mulatta]MOW23451.1 immunoglobulin heavy chain junction region [Macaca mulatta]